MSVRLPFLNPHVRSGLATLLSAGAMLLILGSQPLQAQGRKETKKQGPATKEKADAQAHAPKPGSEKRGSEKSSEAKDSVVLSGHLSRDSARPDGNIRFWISIENKAAVPIQNLRVSDFFIPGFRRPLQIYGGCTGATWDQICKSLAANTAITIWGDISAEESAPREHAFAVMTWDSALSPSQSSTVELGELQRLSWYEATWQWLAQLDVGLPTLSALVVGLYKLRKNKKEKAEAQAKQAQEQKVTREREERERKEKLAAEQREQYQQTWNLMLPQVHRLALHYYMPTANVILTATYHLEECRKPGGNTIDNQGAAFFYLVAFQWHRLRMKRVIAGYYFKNRTAEALMVGLFQKHRELFGVEAPKQQIVLSSFVKPMTRTYRLADFEASRPTWDADQNKFWADFVAWIPTDQCKQDMRVLNAMLKVLSYEINRPYLYWYEEQPPVFLTDDDRRELDVAGAQLEKGEKGMAERVAEYIKEITTGVNLSPGAPQV